MRLQKLIARYGYTSRRKAEELIRQGRVRVDGEPVRRLGVQVSEDAVVEVDGRVINRDIGMVYLALNKPPGYLCSRADPRGRPLVYDLLPDWIRELGVYTVGRLDFHTEGLLLFTNDGDFAQAVGHPSGGITKRYLVEVDAPILYNLIDGWKDGVYIKGECYRIAGYKRLSACEVELVLVEGKNREIRKLFRHVSLGITKLTRVAIGPLGLGNLPQGSWRELSPDELRALLSEARQGAVD